MTTVATSTTTEDDSDDPEDMTGYLKFYELSYLWLGAFAVFTASVVGLFVSCLTGGNKDKPISSKLLCPIPDVFCCCLPESVKESMRCHIYYHEDEEDEEDMKSSEIGKSFSNGFHNPAMMEDNKHTNAVGLSYIKTDL